MAATLMMRSLLPLAQLEVPVDTVTWGEIVAAGAKVGLEEGKIEALSR